MELKASAYKDYGDAAMTRQVLDALPRFARNIAAPLSKIDQIVIVGGSGKSGKITEESSKLLAELPVL